MAHSALSDAAAGAPHDPSARAGLRGWYAVAILTLIYALHSVDRSIMSVLIEPVKEEFGLDDGQLGFLTGLAYSATYALAALPLGSLIDRTNRKKLMAALVALWSGFTALCGAAQGYWSLVASRLAVGAAEAGGAPAALSMIGDLVPPRRRSTAIAIFWSSTPIGTAASFIIGSVIAVQWSWRWAFLIAGFPGLVLALLLLFTVPEPRRGAYEDKSTDDGGIAPSFVETWRHAIRQPVFVHTFLGITLNSMMLSGVLVWQAAFLIRVHDVSLAQAGLLAGLAAGIFGGIGALIGGPLGDRAFAKGGLAALPAVSAATTLLAVASGLVFILAPTLMVAMAGLIVFELVARTYNGPGYSTIIGSVEPRMRGLSVSSLQIATNLIGYGLGPLVAGLVSDAAGGEDPLRWGLIALMAVGVWSSIHYWLAYRAGRRRTSPSERHER
ncbi:MAG: MFS transporter [Allosphingosinicella sp.]|uniref:MFS transporter n=1 Tax=Allosphingosinicella sp. TaxID=2823234 RepID=UPI0039567103